MNNPIPFGFQPITTVVMCLMTKARLGWTNPCGEERARDMILASEKLTKILAGCVESIEREFSKPVPNINEIFSFLLSACAYSHNHPVKDLDSTEFLTEVETYIKNENNLRVIMGNVMLLGAWKEKGELTPVELMDLMKAIIEGMTEVAQ